MSNNQAVDSEIEQIRRLFKIQSTRLEQAQAPLPFEKLPKKELFRKFAFWSDECYARVCLGENETCEMILICWNEGQKTAIHDHGGQKCWVYLLEGEIEETIYESDENMAVKRKTQYQAGQISYMDDSKGYHCLANKTGGRAMSLHVYTSPIRKCQVFSDENHCFESKKMMNHATV